MDPLGVAVQGEKGSRCGFGKLGVPFQGLNWISKGHSRKYCVLDDLPYLKPKHLRAAHLQRWLPSALGLRY